MNITAPAIAYAARLTAHEARDGASVDGNQPLWRLSYLADGTAYLPMATWVAYKTKWDWTGFLNKTFDTLVEKNVPNLVIDLRGNEGGSSVGDVIAARLIDHPVPMANHQHLFDMSKTPPELDTALDTWDPSFKDWGRQAVGPIDLADRATGLAPGTTGGFYRLNVDDSKSGTDVEEQLSPVANSIAAVSGSSWTQRTSPRQRSSSHRW